MPNWIMGFIIRVMRSLIWEFLVEQGNLGDEKLKVAISHPVILRKTRT
jgi:hypothetical protein